MLTTYFSYNLVTFVTIVAMLAARKKIPKQKLSICENSHYFYKHEMNVLLHTRR